MITTEEGFKRIQAQLVIARAEYKRVTNKIDRERVNARIDRLLDEYLLLTARSKMEVPSS